MLMLVFTSDYLWRGNADSLIDSSEIFIVGWQDIGVSSWVVIIFPVTICGCTDIAYLRR